MGRRKEIDVCDGCILEPPLLKVATIEKPCARVRGVEMEEVTCCLLVSVNNLITQ